jgi:glycosyltransferase involved in cell wall biosynthesis
MNIAIYIADLSYENKHLMPWRTVLEVLHELKIAGHGVLLLSGCGNISAVGEGKTYGSIECIEVPKPFSAHNCTIVASCLKQKKIDSFFFPIAFSRTYSVLQNIEKQADCRIVWYIPGGWFGFRQVFKAIRYVGLRSALPYLLQAAMPKRIFVKRLVSMGDRALVTMTDYTAQQLGKYGYKSKLLFPAPPGKAPVARSTDKPAAYLDVAAQLSDTRYFLFFGPPSPIRGIEQVLKAFSDLAKKMKDIKLVCLFRGDNNVDPSYVQQQIERASLEEQIICFWDSVNGADLDLFLKNCFAVLKPFLIVPSEIPLAVLETAGYAKPVIGTGPDGTGAFIDNFGLTVPHANSKALTLAMESLLQDQQLYEQKCRAARVLYENHPNWRGVAEIWLQAAKVETV